MSKKTIFILAGVSLLALYVVVVGLIRWGDTTPPKITLTKPFDPVGPNTPLSLHIEDQETGLQEISIRIMQNRETVSIAAHRLPSEGMLSWNGGKERVFDLEVTPFASTAIPHPQGKATLIVTARDYSWQGLFEGNWGRFTHEFTPKFTPPRLELLSPPRTITQGGSGLVRYRVSADATRHGVQVGPAFFPGYSAPHEYGEFALISFPYNLAVDTPIQLLADDGVGNTALRSLDYRITRKAWRTRRITIDDRFIQKTVLPIIAQTADIQDQGDNLSNFLEVNGTLRRLNNQKIVELSSQSQAEFLWQGPFRQLSNSQVQAAFADHRKYFYQGKLVDIQDHLGFDLAVTKHYPVEAANHGVVVFADFLGIYGNTVVLDHGYGLQSLYAHLASFNVKVGDRVAMGQVIAHSDTTGLAAGDHLHFSLLLHGVQVNPTEWWDPHWVETRITTPLGREQ